MIYDLIIIGGGPSAMSAGIYAARKKLNTLLLAKELGGQPIDAYEIENYPGVTGLLGRDLMKKFAEQLKKFEITIKEGEQAEQIEIRDPNTFVIETDKNSYESRTVIIATGRSQRELDVPGSKEFAGKGITYCATCDAPLFKNKIVAVVGAGDSGMDTAWQLTQYATKIYILNKYPEFRSDNIILQEKITNESKIEILVNATVKEVKGDKFVRSLIYEQHSAQKEIMVDGIFVEIGSQPNSEFIKNVVELNKRNEIIIDAKNNNTSVPGIFAAGDVTDISQKQIVIAAGEGAKTALSVYEYLKNKKI